VGGYGGRSLGLIGVGGGGWGSRGPWVWMQLGVRGGRGVAGRWGVGGESKSGEKFSGEELVNRVGKGEAGCGHGTGDNASRN